MSEVKRIAIIGAGTSQPLVKVARMMSLQDELNVLANAGDVKASDVDSWKDLRREWYRAIWLESAELMEREGWKWWKAPPVPDLAQQQIEVVDIWHFLLSWLIESDVTPEDVVKLFSEQLAVEDCFSTIEASENVAQQALISEGNPYCTLASFRDLCIAYVLDLDALYSFYVFKNVLNVFRQHRGYLSGEYQKIWYGEEDNVHLERIKAAVAQGAGQGEDLFDYVYGQLEGLYPG